MKTKKMIQMKKIDREFIELQKAADGLLLMSEKDIAKNYARALKKLNHKLGNLYRKHALEGQLTMDEMVKYRRIQRLDKDIYDIFLEVYKENRILTRAALRKLTDITYTEVINIANKRTKKTIKGIRKTIDTTNTINDTMAGLNWADRYPKHRTDLIYDLQKVVKEGLEKGITYDGMTNNLKDRVNTDLINPNRIIRTESHRVMSQAKQDSFKDIEKQGIKIKKKWLSSRDERTRAAHSELDGIILDVDEDFESSLGGIGKGPGMMNNAADDIYCRCVLVMEIE